MLRRPPRPVNASARLECAEPERPAGRLIGMLRRLGCMIVITGVLAGCGGPRDGMRVKSVTLSSDYPSYENLAALHAKADLVAIVQLAKTTELLPPDEIPAPCTVFTGRIERAFKGRPGTEVQVKQVGGTYRGIEYTEAGAIALQPGGRYLIFLEVYPDSPAALLNPAQAQYRVG